MTIRPPVHVDPERLRALVAQWQESYRTEMARAKLDQPDSQNHTLRCAIAGTLLGCANQLNWVLGIEDHHDNYTDPPKYPRCETGC